ncbi:MAG: hypothetical protein Q7S50_04700 [bacterium]|nr:hypothetical protein [bacterium]
MLLDRIRTILALIGLCGALFFSWWILLVIMTLLALRWRAWEVPFLGLVVDLLWLPSVGFFYPIPFFTLFGLAVVWLFEPLRNQFLIQ